MKKLEGFFGTKDIEKAFDSLDHIFFKKFPPLKNMTLVKIMGKDEKFCVINGGTTKKYDSLGKSTPQGNSFQLPICLL